MRISDWSSDVCSSDLGLPPISTMGLGRVAVSSLRRVPRPPAKITAFIKSRSVGAYKCIKIKMFSFQSLIHQRSEEHTSELQSLMRISYAVFCLKKQKNNRPENHKIAPARNQKNTTHRSEE